MKIKIAFVILALGSSLYYGLTVFGGCPPSWASSGTFTLCPDRPEDTKIWTITSYAKSIVN